MWPNNYRGLIICSLTFITEVRVLSAAISWNTCKYWSTEKLAISYSDANCISNSILRHFAQQKSIDSLITDHSTAHFAPTHLAKSASQSRVWHLIGRGCSDPNVRTETATRPRACSHRFCSSRVPQRSRHSGASSPSLLAVNHVLKDEDLDPTAMGTSKSIPIEDLRSCMDKCLEFRGDFFEGLWLVVFPLDKTKDSLSLWRYFFVFIAESDWIAGFLECLPNVLRFTHCGIFIHVIMNAGFWALDLPMRPGCAWS